MRHLLQGTPRVGHACSCYSCYSWSRANMAGPSGIPQSQPIPGLLRQPYLPRPWLRRRFRRRASSHDSTGPQRHWEPRQGRRPFRHRHPPCPRKPSCSLRAPLPRRLLTLTGPHCRDPPPLIRTYGQ